jgi:hypothetical protein
MRISKYLQRVKEKIEYQNIYLEFNRKLNIKILQREKEKKRILKYLS